ncbi:Protein of unknown function [Gryllus bimaculatus]|nr:Protein of unknown function [Gryllus bimaculatus]
MTKHNKEVVYTKRKDGAKLNDECLYLKLLLTSGVVHKLRNAKGVDRDFEEALCFVVWDRGKSSFSECCGEDESGACDVDGAGKFFGATGASFITGEGVGVAISASTSAASNMSSSSL